MSNNSDNTQEMQKQWIKNNHNKLLGKIQNYKEDPNTEKQTQIKDMLNNEYATLNYTFGYDKKNMQDKIWEIFGNEFVPDFILSQFQDNLPTINIGYIKRTESERENTNKMVKKMENTPLGRQKVEKTNQRIEENNKAYDEKQKKIKEAETLINSIIDDINKAVKKIKNDKTLSIDEQNKKIIRIVTFVHYFIKKLNKGKISQYKVQAPYKVPELETETVTVDLFRFGARALDKPNDVKKLREYYKNIIILIADKTISVTWKNIRDKLQEMIKNIEKDNLKKKIEPQKFRDMSLNDFISTNKDYIDFIVCNFIIQRKSDKKLFYYNDTSYVVKHRDSFPFSINEDENDENDKNAGNDKEDEILRFTLSQNEADKFLKIVHLDSKRATYNKTVKGNPKLKKVVNSKINKYASFRQRPDVTNKKYQIEMESDERYLCVTIYIKKEAQRKYDTEWGRLDKTMDFLHFVQSVSVDELEEMVDALKNDNFTIAITNNEDEEEQTEEEHAEPAKEEGQTQAEQPKEQAEHTEEQAEHTEDDKPQGVMGGGVNLFEKEKQDTIEITLEKGNEVDGGQHGLFIFDRADKINVKSDGNCAYRAISLGLAEINSRAKNNKDVKPVIFYTHQELRELFKHVKPNKYDPKYDAVILRGQDDTIWAQNEEFEILAEELGICFVVYRQEGFAQNGVKWQLIAPLNDRDYCQETPKIYILNSGGEVGEEGTHFELLYNLR